MSEHRKWHGHLGTVLNSKDGFDVLDCQTCGFAHIVPIPTQDELTKVYEHEYYSTEKPWYLERSREDLEWLEVVYDERYDTFEELLHEGRRRILDVGSGPGFFLLRGVEKGWEAVGIEPSAQASRHARELGLDIVEGFLSEESASVLGQFDVINMSEVLEHIPSPAEFLRLVKGMLHGGGLLCLSVPNDYNALQMALRQACGYDPWWVAPPHHINYFTFDSLSHLLETSGFDVLIRETSFPMELFLLMGDDYVGDDQRGRECQARRKAFELNMVRAGQGHLKRDLYRALAALGAGRHVVLFARKR